MVGGKLGENWVGSFRSLHQMGPAWMTSLGSLHQWDHNKTLSQIENNQQGDHKIQQTISIKHMTHKR